MNKYITQIKDLASTLPHTKIMEVCGGHTNTILKNGIRDIIPQNIELVSGPGCPICVTSQQDIDSIIHLAKNGIPISTYGDLLHVPGTQMSLDDARSKGADIKMLFSATEALQFPNHTFVGIGFETTTPMTAYLLKHNIRVFSTHKVMPPPMNLLIQEDSQIKGFIDPGHVAAITGSNMWNQINAPQVICGFKPEQLIRGIAKLLKLISDDKNNKSSVINDYNEVVTPEGNTKAKQLISETMIEDDADWRGMGIIPKSGLKPKDPRLDAKLIYKNLLSNLPPPKPSACRCGEIIKGIIKPNDCPLYKTVCTPTNPQGACMVSMEGACAAYYQYQQHLPTGGNQ